MKKLLSTSTFVAGIFSITCLASANNNTKEIIKGYDFEGNGWQKNLECFDGTFKQEELPSISLIPEKEMDKALYNQLSATERKLLTPIITEEQKEFIRKQKAVLEKMSEQTGTDEKAIFLSGLKFKRLRGEDGCGNVLLTGYFTPMLQLKRKPDSTYKYPLYTKPSKWPNDQALTRSEIDDFKGLQGLGLEIGYSDSLLNNYFAQVQGSTFAHFIDTNEYMTLAFSGKNGKKYESLGKYLVSSGHVSKKDISLQAIRNFFEQHPELLSSVLNINPSYVFFREVKSPPITSSGVPVINNITAAVDPDVIPHGSVLLVEFPIINKNGKVGSREFRLLIASDSGSAIKGAGHIDVYMGENQQQAGFFHHYGQVWLLEI
ncbi:murein transglycosylase A [Thalassotalea castellviae]|uniref:peptidoglycan lytic exotransglycosylase n=1 Tax=Thalassotalea castellviae TaxID=3075612 RepID=A0ABU3A5N6_9GAMM|nr:murein transglycosylase A [Thalassotalea sp. W431]MDT0604306.1 murein transglycosylase A [Thalassotalea sp. W431]